MMEHHPTKIHKIELFLYLHIHATVLLRSPSRLWGSILRITTINGIPVCSIAINWKRKHVKLLRPLPLLSFTIVHQSSQGQDGEQSDKAMSWRAAMTGKWARAQARSLLHLCLKCTS